MVIEDVTATAVWVENGYIIALNLNGGKDASGKAVVNKVSATYTEEVLIRDLIPEGANKAGYKISGVALKAKGPKDYELTDSVDRLTSKNKGTVTFYVIWEKDE